MNNGLCPKVEAMLNLLGKKWNALIIYALSHETMKFSEIEKYIPGLSSRLLNERLKYLETEGIIHKEVLVEDSIKIRYSLTDKGEELAKAFSSLEQWAEKWN